MANPFNLGSLFNADKDLENMLSRVDTLVDSLAKQKKVETEKDIADNALREILSTIDNKEEEDSVGGYHKLLEELSISSDRLSRYKIYDEIYSSVQLLKRIVGVYISNCLQKDVLTGKALTIKETDKMKDDTQRVDYYKKFVEGVIDHYGLESNLKDTILHHILRYGDHYIEIIDLQEDINNLPSPAKTPQVITESNLKDMEAQVEHTGHNETTKPGIINQVTNQIYNGLIEIEDHYEQDLDTFESLKLFNEQKGDKNSDDFDVKLLNRVILRFHKPSNIVVLTTKYDTIIGYVEIREKQKAEATPGIGVRFANVIRQLSSMSGNKKGNNTVIIQKLISKVIIDLVKKIGIEKESSESGKNQHEINKQYEEMLHNKLGDDLFYMIKKLFVETNPNSASTNKMRKLSVRFISKDRMVRMCNNPIEFQPYGTSVLDALVYPGKLYLLTQLTNVVSKLSRAALIRKWTIETGPREHHSGLIQKLKRELRNQRVSVDDLVSFKSVPRILSDFKDIILLSKKGQRFVDVDLQNMHDANVKVADLEDTRREIIALSGVPAPYLGYNDVIELREQLVHVNITFATEIISIQDSINTGMNELVNKISKIVGVNDDPNIYVKVSLRPPVVLLLQMIETIMASISNIQQNFQTTNIDFNPYYLLKRYLPTIDWDEFSKEAREFELFQKAQGKSEEQNPGSF